MKKINQTNQVLGILISIDHQIIGYPNLDGGNSMKFEMLNFGNGIQWIHS